MSLFDNIDLPAESKDLPAEITPDEEDKETPETPENREPETPETPSNPPANTDPPADTSETPEKEDEPPTDSDKKDDDQEQKPPEKDLTPFHEHPDWQKMQDRLKAAEERATAAEEKANKASEATRANKEFDGLSAAKIATKLVEKKVAEGWKPKDQLEVNEAYAEELVKAQAIVKEREESEQSKTTAEVQRKLDAKFEQLNITDPEERKKVENQVSGWAKAGMNVSFETFDVAAENLRLKGEIGKPKEPTQTEESKEKEAEIKKQKADANRKLGKTKSTGDNGTAKKPNYDYLHKNDLDTIVMEQSERLG